VLCNLAENFNFFAINKRHANEIITFIKGCDYQYAELSGNS